MLSVLVCIDLQYHRITNKIYPFFEMKTGDFYRILPDRIPGDPPGRSQAADQDIIAGGGSGCTAPGDRLLKNKNRAT